MSFFLSQTSKARLETCHADLQLVIEEAIKYSPVDFGISHGRRSPEEQFELYKKGRTKSGNKWLVTSKKDIVTFKDGYTNLSKHNETPSDAVDIYCWPREVMYDEWHLMCVVGVILSTANRLYDEGKINKRVTSGVDWNRNGVFVNQDHNERFVDMPHFQV